MIWQKVREMTVQTVDLAYCTLGSTYVVLVKMFHFLPRQHNYLQNYEYFPHYISRQCCGSALVSKPDSGIWWPKIVKFYSWKTNLFLVIKNQKSKIKKYIYSSSSKKDVQATEEASSPQKRPSSTGTSKQYITFFSLFVGLFCPPGSGSAYPTRILIRIQPINISTSTADPDPQHRLYRRYRYSKYFSTGLDIHAVFIKNFFNPFETQH